MKLLFRKYIDKVTSVLPNNDKEKLLKERSLLKRDMENLCASIHLSADYFGSLNLPDFYIKVLKNTISDRIQ